MARTSNDGSGAGSGADAWELYDATLGRVIAGPFPSQAEGNVAKTSAPDSHKLTVRKVRDGDEA